MHTDTQVDPYMFHQPNLRQADVEPILLLDQTRQLSLLQMWLEVVTTQLIALVNWPIITLKHDHIAQSFNRRMIHDGCGPYVQYITSNSSISGIRVLTATNNTCDVPVPIQVPTALADYQGYRTEQVGNDPLTVWVLMSGDVIDFDFIEPIAY